MSTTNSKNFKRSMMNSNFVAAAKSVVNKDTLTESMEKQARRTGVLNLSNRGLSTIPEKVYGLNFSDDEKDTSTMRTNRDDDAWWEQVVLTTLDASSNGISEISPKIANLDTLTHLIFHNNKLEFLPEEIGDLQNLVCLNLSRNQLKSLPQSFFKLGNLRCLNLAYNVLEDYPESFGCLESLEILDFSNNKLTGLSENIQMNTHLHELYLSSNKIVRLPLGIFKLENLRKLELNKNCLQELPESIGNLSKLEFLYLQHNKIRTLPSFKGNEALYELHAANNSIEVMPVEMCKNLSNLKLLDLRDNKLVDVPKEIGLMKQLQQVNLSNNSINNLPYTLGYLESLTSLQVSGNPIKSINRLVVLGELKKLLETLRNRKPENESECIDDKASGDGKIETNDDFPSKRQMYGAKSLKVTNKNLTEVPERVFKDASEEGIQIVNFSNNRFQAVPKGITLMADFLQELNFSNNQLQELPVEISNLHFLTFLDLSVNRLQEFPSEMAQLQNLRHINISNNRFTALPSCIYELENLEVLSAKDNHITQIDVSENGLVRCTRLNTLDLRNNDIHSVPPQLGLLTNIKSLDIIGNPFRLPRQQVLEKGTEEVLAFLRDRIPK